MRYNALNEGMALLNSKILFLFDMVENRNACESYLYFHSEEWHAETSEESGLLSFYLIVLNGSDFVASEVL